jgi:hypothetical protein
MLLKRSCPAVSQMSAVVNGVEHGIRTKVSSGSERVCLEMSPDSPYRKERPSHPKF